MKCLEMIHFYLLPEGTHVVSASTATTARTPPTPGTPRRHRYRSESLRAVLERVEDEWIPRTPRKTTSVSHEARPTPIPLSDSNPGLGISQSEKGTPSKPAMSPLSTPVSKPKGHRHSASASSSRTAASENPFAPTTSTHRKTGQHDLAFFSAMANSASQSSSKKRPSPQKETPQDTFGPVKRSGVAASPRRPLRSPLKRSLTSSPKSREPTSRPSSSPRKTSMTPRQNHPIVPLPSRRRSVVQQEQQPPQSPLTRSQTDPDLVSTPKNSTLSRSTSEESPLSDILNGVRHPTDSPSHLGTQKYEDPDLRRRASLQLSQSRSALRHSLGLISNSNTSTPAAAPRAPARAPDRDDRSSTASTQSTTDNASSPVRSHVSNVKKAVPSPISRSKTDAKSRLSASYQSMSSPAESQVKSVDEKKQLLSRHLGDVDGLMRRFDAIGVR